MDSRRNNPTMAFCLLAAAMACSFSGCTMMGNMMTGIADCFEFRQDLHREIHKEKQDLREEIARVRQEERMKLKEAMLAEARSDLAQLKQCLPETAPFTETTVALPLQQKYVFGPPEVDMREMEELLKAEREGHEERMSQWRQDMKAFNERKRLHDKNEQQRLTDQDKNPQPVKENKCGCQQALVTGQCGCSAEQKQHCGCEEALRCGHCCCRRKCKEEVTCEYAPRKHQPFREKPPEMPKEALLTSRLPIKMRMQLVQELGDSKVTNVRGGRAPLQEKPPAPFKEQCQPGECTDRIPCDSAAPGGMGGFSLPPAPVVSDEPETIPNTRAAAPVPTGPPMPPPEARAPKAQKKTLGGLPFIFGGTTRIEPKSTADNSAS